MWVEAFIDTTEMFDAAHCPDPIPAGFKACMVYAGGSSATHQWDTAELNRVDRLARLPVWVPTPGSEDPVKVANQFLDWLTNNGVWPVDPRTNERTRIMWDMETGQEPDAAWLGRAADVTAKSGYFNIVYGSPNTLFKQPPRAGYFVADPNPIDAPFPHMYLRPEVVGTQYQFDFSTPGGVIDRSLITTDLLRQLWLPR